MSDENILTGPDAVYARGKLTLGGTSSNLNTDCGPVKYGEYGVGSYAITGSRKYKSLNTSVRALPNPTSFKDVKPGWVYNFSSSASNMSVGIIMWVYASSETSAQIRYLKASNGVVSMSDIINLSSSSRTKVFDTSNYDEIAPFELNQVGITERSNYNNIANAIRERGGFTDTYYPSEMSQAILDIPHDEVPPAPEVDPNTLISTLVGHNLHKIDNTVFKLSQTDPYELSYGIFYSCGGLLNFSNPLVVNFTQDMFPNTTKEITLGEYCFGGNLFAPTTFDMSPLSNPLRIGPNILSSTNATVFKGNVSYLFCGKGVSGDYTSGVFDGSNVSELYLTGTSKVNLTGDLGTTSSPTLVKLFVKDSNADSKNSAIKIYVDPSLVSQYKSDPYWANYSSQFYPIPT